MRNCKNPFTGDVKYMRVRKFSDFDWNRHLSQKRYEIGPWLLWNVNRSRVADQSVSVPMTLNDLERQDMRGQIFQADLLNSARAVWRRTKKFSRITWEGRISRGQPHSHRKGAGPQRSPILWVPFLRTPFDTEVPNSYVVTYREGACF